MPSNVTVDTTNETVTLGFVDDKGNPTNPPSGASVTFVSDNPEAATVEQDANNVWQGNVTPVGVGDTRLGAQLQNALEADGATPIPDPDPVSLHVDPGAAAGARLTLS